MGVSGGALDEQVARQQSRGSEVIQLPPLTTLSPESDDST